jgi:hypothetical protein
MATLAASVANFPPNPIGEKLYRQHLYHEMLLLGAIVACVLLVTFLIHKFGPKARSLDSSN